MFKAIVIILIAATVIKADHLPNVSKISENPDHASSSTEKSRDGITELHTKPVEAAFADSEELSKLGAPENTDMMIAPSPNSEQVKVDKADSRIVSSPKMKRSKLESDRDVIVNDDPKSDEMNSDSHNDEKVLEIASASSDSTHELRADQPEAKDDTNIKEYSEEKLDVSANLGEVSGRRMLQQDVVLDTKGRSGHAYDSEDIDNLRAVPPRDFTPFDMLNPLDIKPTFKNDLIMPHYPSLPRPGMFFNPAFMPNPMLFNRMGSKEMMNLNNRRFASGFDQSQPKSSEEIRTLNNAYPFQPSLTARTGEPANKLDVFWKLSQATELPKPQLPFTAERQSAYQRSFNQFGIPRFRRSANFNVDHNMKLKDDLLFQDNRQVL